jgi:hypothetical protein
MFDGLFGCLRSGATGDLMIWRPPAQALSRVVPTIGFGALGGPGLAERAERVQRCQAGGELGRGQGIRTMSATRESVVAVAAEAHVLSGCRAR